MREYFNIQNDFTPQEEARLRAEFQWCEAIEDNGPDSAAPVSTASSPVSHNGEEQS